jgi:hypothetical protein
MLVLAHQLVLADALKRAHQLVQLQRLDSVCVEALLRQV